MKGIPWPIKGLTRPKLQQSWTDDPTVPLKPSTGKSGSFMYLTADKRFFFKTIHRAEMRSLKRILPAYVKVLASSVVFR